MSTTNQLVGPRGIALLVTTGVVGLALATHGWSHRQPGFTAGALAAPATPQAHSSPARPRPHGTTSGPSRGGGPLLSSQSYASYSYRVWPGSPSSAARAAMTGLSISVHRSGGGISLSAGVAGQPHPRPRTYPQGARVYVIEASMGDEAGSHDYNLGDDGLVVTDAAGRIVR